MLPLIISFEIHAWFYFWGLHIWAIWVLYQHAENVDFVWHSAHNLDVITLSHVSLYCQTVSNWIENKQPGRKVGFITCSSIYFQKNINSLHEHIKTGNLSRAREHLTDETAFIKDRAGRSSLHIAVLYQRKFVVKHLLKSYPGTVHIKDDVSLLLISYLLSSIELDIQRIHRGVLNHCVNPRLDLWKVQKVIFYP